jgi:pimeloyl-ACP methyl ester carboxylesterase
LLIRQQFPKYQLVTIENAGHWVQEENPKDFNEAVKKFLVKKKILNSDN